MANFAEVNSQGRGFSVEEDDDESNLDYFYDEPGTLPGTLDLEVDAPPPEAILIDYSEPPGNR